LAALSFFTLPPSVMTAAARMPVPASQLYAKNLENLLGLMITEEGTVNVNLEDDILAAALITQGGTIKNERAAGRESA